MNARLKLALKLLSSNPTILIVDWNGRYINQATPELIESRPTKFLDTKPRNSRFDKVRYTISTNCLNLGAKMMCEGIDEYGRVLTRETYDEQLNRLD